VWLDIGFVAGAVSGTSTSPWLSSGSDIYYDAGNVGIGTSNPTSGYLLDVNGSTRFRSYMSVDGNFDVLGANGVWIPSGWLRAGGAADNYLMGRLGVGINTPTEQLHVAGNAIITGNLDVTGNIAAKYQDIAEWVVASKPILPGMVVILDPEIKNQVLPSATTYDTTVAGVVSETPGIVLGEAGHGKVKVATTGRVLVKVDSSYGPIKIGDLLVTSDKAGVAMVSKPIEIQGRKIHSPGTIIGKALEPLAEGEGEILILLSLQ